MTLVCALKIEPPPTKKNRASRIKKANRPWFIDLSLPAPSGRTKCVYLNSFAANPQKKVKVRDVIVQLGDPRRTDFHDVDLIFLFISLRRSDAFVSHGIGRGKQQTTGTHQNI